MRLVLLVVVVALKQSSALGHSFPGLTMQGPRSEGITTSSIFAGQSGSPSPRVLRQGTGDLSRAEVRETMSLGAYGCVVWAVVVSPWTMARFPFVLCTAGPTLPRPSVVASLVSYG